MRDLNFKLNAGKKRAQDVAYERDGLKARLQQYSIFTSSKQEE